ncbi:MAG: PLP-dependent aspartate aminotransferase family protein, partial [Actinomycetales bacterium]|nr:PLP-dependent aspartate aminotransferase family protein [Actinomycetales bacterium]
MGNSSNDLPERAIDTVAVHSGRPERTPDGSINPDIVLSSTVHAGGPVGYLRHGNETFAALEATLGELEGGTATIFSSGMAAANAVFDLVPLGGVIVASKHSYAAVGTRLAELAARGQIELRLVDVTNQADIAKQINGDGKSADLVWLETPTNPLLEICDIKATASIAKQAGALLAVDNTFMTPVRQLPISLGADIVMHSVTKGLSGHTDLLMGATVAKDPEVATKLLGRRTILGAAPSAFDAFLALRGIRTLAIRIDRAEANAIELANRLTQHQKVAKVYYPGLTSTPNSAVQAAQTTGPGFIISIEVGNSAADADKVCGATKILTNATSLGGVESLLERRRRWAHENKDVPENLIRISVGIENVEDLWN